MEESVARTAVGGRLVTKNKKKNKEDVFGQLNQLYFTTKLLLKLDFLKKINQRFGWHKNNFQVNTNSYF